MNQVVVVVHGYDHLYVKQELEGIMYQDCPKPSNTRGTYEYGYQSGALRLCASEHQVVSSH